MPKRKVAQIITSSPTVEGAGVRLHRAFSHGDVNLDPFLLLDDFHSADPKDYMAGFPWHPHRGIETVTYMINGIVEHGDSMKNKGIIKSGDVQWMTAGSGIIHQEMPKCTVGTMQGFQLWVNLPANKKMIDPRYRGIKHNEIPEIEMNKGVKLKLIAGFLNEVHGPVKDLTIDVEYFDISMEKNSDLTLETKIGY